MNTTNEQNEALLTAYALGELEGADRAVVEALIAGDAAARAHVEATRETAQRLAHELAGENLSALLPAHRAAIEERMYVPPKQKIARRPLNVRFIMVVSAVAACVVVGLSIASLLPLLNRAREEVATNQRLADAVRRQPGSWDLTPPPSPTSEQELRRSTEAPGAGDPQGYSGMTGGYPGMMPGSGTPGKMPGMFGFGGGYPGMAAAPDGYPGMAAPPGSATTFRDNIHADASRRVQDQNSIRWPEDEDPADPMANVARRNTEAYDRLTDNPFRPVASNPLSTFSIDVDTASYSNMRRFLTQNSLPPKDAVRIEELINYFPYAYAAPGRDDPAPFAAHIEVAGCPWNTSHRLVRIGLKGREIETESRPPSNLVFLIDVSGSMAPDNRLPLVKRGLQMLVGRLTENDRVAIVVYAGATGLALPSTTGDQKGTILGAIDALGAGGSTNGAGGIERAYEEAVRNFIPRGTNRVILCTDGDFNVGVTDPIFLTRMIEEKAKTGVFLSVLGFGMGNLKDATLEKLADKGNGNYAYIDTLREARKVLVEQMTGTLVTIAKDVKIQVEFNPAVASSYRLIGYENRILAKEDFNDDTKDAGEIGAGHTVTALYEVVPAGAAAPQGARPKVDDLKYQKQPAAEPKGPEVAVSNELLTVKLRYKEPEGQASKLLEFPITDAGTAYAKASEDYKFAAAVAALGMILRESPHKGTASFASVTELAQEGLGQDDSGYRAEFIDLVRKAAGLGR